MPTGKLDAHKRFSERIAKVYREYGALRVIDCILDPDVSDGTGFHAEGARSRVQGSLLRDFHAAAATKAGETVVLSWTEWPSTETNASRECWQIPVSSRWRVRK